jgi:hypothetical protein
MAGKLAANVRKTSARLGGRLKRIGGKLPANGRRHSERLGKKTKRHEPNGFASETKPSVRHSASGTRNAAAKPNELRRVSQVPPPSNWCRRVIVDETGMEVSSAATA